MKVEIKKNSNGFKIISSGHTKHPALKVLAELVEPHNKTAGTLKIGIYNISSAEFKNTKRVYSYISKKVEYMSPKNYRKFIKGERQMCGKVKKKTHDSLLKDWVLENGLECVMDDKLEV